MDVSETGYYKWKRTRNKPRAWQLLLVKIHGIVDEYPDNENYGIERVLIALQQKGETVSRSTVIRAMRKGNLLLRAEEILTGSLKRIRRLRDPRMY